MESVRDGAHLHRCHRALAAGSRRRSCRVRCSSANRSQSFWDRLGEACSVVLGVQQSPQTAKHRFSKLLVADRGFDTDTLSQFYKLAKVAISEQVVLDENSIQEEATVERLGELQFQFRVKRIKSSAQDEPWAVPTLVEYEPE